MPNIRNILIANRGEIACRIIRTAKALGRQTIAVYSDADENALHVQMADKAVYLGPPPARESYLDIEKIISAAKMHHVDAIHPGYGFLSENAEFAAACTQAGIIFIGPPASAIKSMGSKSAAKSIMSGADVPLLPGYHGKQQNMAALKKKAADVGYPILLKASAGGGGKGMRVVSSASEFADAFAATKRESLNAFGDDTLLLERFIENPRHIEVQVFCDQQGNGLYVADRDCSVQRRHQKVVEEAPAPNLSDTTRSAMGEAALACAQAIGYVGAGTVEFLLDEDESFYFMEMNTRLQVEHPVTEMVTGVDLVAWQIHVAEGNPLTMQQSQINTRGHAVEVRIYAEDTANDFLPATGAIYHLNLPEQNAALRCDIGVQQGDYVDVHYDPMLAKLIAWGETRPEAINRLCRALDEFNVAPLVTNVAYLNRVLRHDAFHAMQVTTRFLDTHRHELTQPPATSTDIAVAATLLAPTEANTEPDPWGTTDGWWLNSESSIPLRIVLQGATYEVQIKDQRGTEEASLEVVITGLDEDPTEKTVVRNATAHAHKRPYWLGNTTPRTVYLFSPEVTATEALADLGDQPQAQYGAPIAPMNGTIVALLAPISTRVDAGEPLVIMEAMKMEHTIRAASAGTVCGYHVAEGELVEGGQILVDFEVEQA